MLHQFDAGTHARLLATAANILIYINLYIEITSHEFFFYQILIKSNDTTVHYIYTNGIMEHFLLLIYLGSKLKMCLEFKKEIQ